MKKSDLAGFAALVTIVRKRSSRRTAATLSVTPSMSSHTPHKLETQLGIRLLNRTTHNISPIEANEHLLAHLDSVLEDIAAMLNSLNRFRETPHGLVRVNAPRNAIGLVLTPHFGKLARNYPGVTPGMVANEGFANIAETGFDAGIRLGEDLQHGMRAVQVGPNLRLAIIATSVYFRRQGRPGSPEELLGHRCIGWCKVFSGELHKWRFSKGMKALSVTVSGSLIFDDPCLMLQAALADVGITFAIEKEVAKYLAAGRLERVLADWYTPFLSLHLHCPNRCSHLAALSVMTNLLRYPGEEYLSPAQVHRRKRPWQSGGKCGGWPVSTYGIGRGAHNRIAVIRRISAYRWIASVALFALPMATGDKGLYRHAAWGA